MPRKPNYDRDDLIERARDLFWQRGWAGTSLKHLEASLQMKPGSFYAAFGSKTLARTEGPLPALQKFPCMVISNDTAPAKACMLSKTLLELQAHRHPLAKKANTHLLKMEQMFAELFAQAQAAGDISAGHNPRSLARRYQSDVLGLRVSAEREGVDAAAIAGEIADGLARL